MRSSVSAAGEDPNYSPRTTPLSWGYETQIAPRYTWVPCSAQSTVNQPPVTVESNILSFWVLVSILLLVYCYTYWNSSALLSTGVSKAVI